MPSGTPRVALDLGQQLGHRLEVTHFNPQMPEALRTSGLFWGTNKKRTGRRISLGAGGFPFRFAGGFGFGGSSLRCFGDFSATWQVACSQQECDKPSARQICGWRLHVSTHKCPKHYGQADCSGAQTQSEQEGDDFAISFPFAASAAISWMCLCGMVWFTETQFAHNTKKTFFWNTNACLPII